MIFKCVIITNHPRHNEPLPSQCSQCRHAPAIIANSKVVFTLILTRTDSWTNLMTVKEQMPSDLAPASFLSSFLNLYSLSCPATCLSYNLQSSCWCWYYSQRLLSQETCAFWCCYKDYKPRLLTLDFNFDVDLNSFCLPVLKRTQSSTFSGIYNSLLLI